MRPRSGPTFRSVFLWAGICLSGMPAFGAEPWIHAPEAASPGERIVESNAGGPRSSTASQIYAQGVQLAAAGDARCVDLFFVSAVESWQDLTEGLSQHPPCFYYGSLRLYNSAVCSLVVTGHRLGRLDPARGLQVVIDNRWQTIPIVSEGLNWRLEQIDCFQPAGTCFQNPTFACSVTYGVGASLLGLHFRRRCVPGEEHYLGQHPIPITAVIQGDGGPESYRLELHNPLKKRTIEVKGRESLLSRNIAAAVEYVISRLDAEVNAWTAFFNPEVVLDYEGVLMFQPYQPGKIPVVLVHGLLSNPATWGSMINQFMNEPELMERFQIWAYLYPTSVPFIQTAAELRRDLRNTVWSYDPGEQDSAVQNMLLVGHSMGGLLARLQVTWSGDFLWNEFATAPFGQIRVGPRTRRELAEIFFFGPQPFVKRVVFIAVPHRGSKWSSRLLGFLGRTLAGRLTTFDDVWRELVDLNPGVLRAFLRIGLPSSVDGLSSNSPSLRGIARMPFAPWVRLHSIIGTGGCEPCCPGDGVVAIESARLAGVDSEFYVDETHSKINEHPHTIHEVERILWVHWTAYERQNPQTPPAAVMPMIPVPMPAK